MLGAAITFLGTVYLITPQYQSSAKFYVNNRSISVGSASLSLESGDINAAKSLVDSYIVILQTRESLNDVIDYAGVNRTYSELQGMITASSVNSTEIFEVVVTSPDPVEAERIAREGIGEEVFQRMKRSAFGRRVRDLDSFDSTCFRLCAYHFSDFDYFRFPAMYESVTEAEMREFLANAVRTDNCSLTRIDPITEGVNENEKDDRNGYGTDAVSEYGCLRRRW